MNTLCQVLAFEAGPRPAGRLEEIRDNLHDRIAEAEREGWLGEIEGLKVSLACTEDKLAQIDTALQRQDRPSTSACPRSPTSPAAPSRPHRKEPRDYRELSSAQ